MQLYPDLGSLGLSAWADLSPSNQSRHRPHHSEYYRPEFAGGREESVDGEDLLRLGAWAEKIGCAGAVKIPTALAAPAIFFEKRTENSSRAIG